MSADSLDASLLGGFLDGQLAVKTFIPPHGGFTVSTISPYSDLKSSGKWKLDFPCKMHIYRPVGGEGWQDLVLFPPEINAKSSFKYPDKSKRRLREGGPDRESQWEQRRPRSQGSKSQRLRIQGDKEAETPRMQKRLWRLGKQRKLRKLKKLKKLVVEEEAEEAEALRLPWEGEGLEVQYLAGRVGLCCLEGSPKARAKCALSDAISLEPACLFSKWM